MIESELDALIEAGTAALGIPIQPEWRDAVRLHLRITLDHAANVLSFPLDDNAEPAPVFRT
jgi:hypothetical protein